MAMILDAFLGNFSSLLTKMAEDEVGMLLGVPGEIERLEKTVCDIQCVLADAERKQTESIAIKRWLVQLKDVMYDADDLMDLCQIKAEDRRAPFSYLSSSRFSCGGIKLLSCLRNPIFAHKIGKQIKELNSRLDEISKKKSDLGLIALMRDVAGSSSNFQRGHSDISRKTDPLIVQADIVGDKIEEDTDKLVKWLTTTEEKAGNNAEISAVAIVGMGGIGKTTLAKKVYNDPRIKEEFHLKLWVGVSQHLKQIELLKCIIREAGGNHGAADTRAELAPMLQGLVRGKKFFLVLDDVWPQSQTVWDGLLRNPMSSGARGSKLLITSRDDGVARFMKATPHRVDKLSHDDGWSLLIKQVALDENDSKVRKDVGIELVKRCDGLPLAIKAIGGVLRGKHAAEWQTILGSTFWSLGDLPSEFPRAFRLSYEDLPSHLKQCFIFYSLYPEDHVFGNSNIVYLWLAKGFLWDKGDLSFLELGLKCYKELLSRNLFEADEDYYGQEICKMHDMWRSFGRYLVNGTSFILKEGVGGGGEGDRLPLTRECLLKLRRLSIERSVVVSNVEFLNKEKSTLRTLLLINNSIGDVMFNALPSFSHLRILDLSYSKISSLPDSFCGLVHLRYLNASASKLETLPNSIGNLRKLVFLCLGSCKQLSSIPSSVFNLLDLRFLSFYNSNVEVFPAGLKKLKKLVALYGFKPDKNSSKGLSSLEDLGTMSQLSDLQLFSLEKASEVTAAKEANLKKKVHLKDLQFNYTILNQETQVSKSMEEKKAAEDVLNALSPPSLDLLNIEGYFGHQLPNWLHVGRDPDPSNLRFLRYLAISHCECFSLLPPLGQLSNLDFLRIKDAKSVVRIGHEFLLDDSRDPRAEVWEEAQPAMPKLKELYIKGCPKLSSLPKGLSRHATSLETLEIYKAGQIKSLEDLPSVKDLYVPDNPNLKRIANLPNLSYIIIRNCPNLERLENLKASHRMELIDSEMETLPEYLKTVMPKKLTVQCSEELLLKITSQEVGSSSERQKFDHIPVVKLYSPDQSLYATYQQNTLQLASSHMN